MAGCIAKEGAAGESAYNTSHDPVFPATRVPSVRPAHRPRVRDNRRRGHYRRLANGRRPDPRQEPRSGLVQDLLSYVILSGFIVAHLYSVLAYFPREAMQDPLLLLKFWEDISSFGDLSETPRLCSFSASRRRMSTRRPGCATWTSSHTSSLSPGRSDASPVRSPRPPRHGHVVPVGISLKSPEAQGLHHFLLPGGRPAGGAAATAILAKMAFHDLGWYEFLYMSCLMVPASLRWPEIRPPGSS